MIAWKIEENKILVLGFEPSCAAFTSGSEDNHPQRLKSPHISSRIELNYLLRFNEASWSNWSLKGISQALKLSLSRYLSSELKR